MQRLFYELGLEGTFWDLGRRNLAAFPYNHRVKAEAVSVVIATNEMVVGMIVDFQRT